MNPKDEGRPGQPNGDGAPPGGDAGSDPPAAAGDPAAGVGRRALVGGVALAALAGGIWWSARRGSAGGASEGGSAGAGEAAPPGFWSLRFDAPSGQPVALADLRGRPLLVNFWATWCAPCVKEMPEIDRFFVQNKSNGWQVVGLAIDGPTPVREFLGRIPVSFPIGLAGLEGTELVRTLGNDRGGLPFTVAFDARGRIVRRKLGETNAEELSGWARELA